MDRQQATLILGVALDDEPTVIRRGYRMSLLAARSRCRTVRAGSEKPETGPTENEVREALTGAL